MNIRPILFSSEMVRAILDGRKTQTRRVIKLRNDSIVDLFSDAFLPSHGFASFDTKKYHARKIRCPFGKVGDVLWVRESWAKFSGIDETRFVYKADGLYDTPAKEHLSDNRWQSPIFMPRNICRLILKIKTLQVQRLQEINVKEICAEGLAKSASEFAPITNAFSVFANTWDSINSKRGFSWESNPFVWVIEFEPLEVKR